MKPRTDLRRAMMLPALKLSLDGLELRYHSLLRRDPPDGKGSIGLALPAHRTVPGTCVSLCVLLLTLLVAA